MDEVLSADSGRMAPLTSPPRPLSSSHLEQLGSLVGGLAHEMNTPLQTVGHNVHYVRDLVPRLCQLIEAADAAVHEDATAPSRAAYEALRAECDEADWLGDMAAALGDALEGCERATSSVRAMAEFAQQRAGAETMVDVGHLLTSLVTLTRNEWKYVADLRLDVPADLPRVLADECALSQQCVGLILAAAGAVRDARADRPGPLGRIDVCAMCQQGSIEVTVRHSGGVADTHAPHTDVRVGSSPDAAACLRLPLGG